MSANERYFPALAPPQPAGEGVKKNTKKEQFVRNAKKIEQSNHLSISAAAPLKRTWIFFWLTKLRTTTSHGAAARTEVKRLPRRTFTPE